MSISDIVANSNPPEDKIESTSCKWCNTKLTTWDINQNWYICMHCDTVCTIRSRTGVPCKLCENMKKE